MSWAEDLLTPGTAYKVVPIINTSLGLLIGVLFLSALRWSAIAIHLYAMIFLALGLLTTLNWFVAEL